MSAYCTTHNTKPTTWSPTNWRARTDRYGYDDHWSNDVHVIASSFSFFPVALSLSSLFLSILSLFSVIAVFMRARVAMVIFCTMCA